VCAIILRTEDTKAKSKCYKIMVIPVLMYGCECLVMPAEVLRATVSRNERQVEKIYVRKLPYQCIDERRQG
jgi:hypothetical protein